MDTKLIIVALIVAAIVIAGIAITMNKPAKTAATSQIPKVPSQNEINMPSENEITTNTTLPEPNTTEINLPSEI